MDSLRRGEVGRRWPFGNVGGNTTTQIKEANKAKCRNKLSLNSYGGASGRTIENIKPRRHGKDLLRSSKRRNFEKACIQRLKKRREASSSSSSANKQKTPLPFHSIARSDNRGRREIHAPSTPPATTHKVREKRYYGGPRICAKKSPPDGLNGRQTSLGQDTQISLKKREKPCRQFSSLKTTY